jgi:hypothetical protein
MQYSYHQLEVNVPVNDLPEQLGFEEWDDAELIAELEYYNGTTEANGDDPGSISVEHYKLAVQCAGKTCVLTVRETNQAQHEAIVKHVYENYDKQPIQWD